MRFAEVGAGPGPGSLKGRTRDRSSSHAARPACCRPNHHPRRPQRRTPYQHTRQDRRRGSDQANHHDRPRVRLLRRGPHGRAAGALPSRLSRHRPLPAALLPALAEAGYHAVAPFVRGTPPPASPPTAPTRRAPSPPTPTRCTRPSAPTATPCSSATTGAPSPPTAPPPTRPRPPAARGDDVRTPRWARYWPTAFYGFDYGQFKRSFYLFLSDRRRGPLPAPGAAGADQARDAGLAGRMSLPQVPGRTRRVVPSGARSASQNIAWMIPTVRARCGSERSVRWATASSTRASAPVSGR